MLLNNRHGSVDSDAYRYGFQGQERDDEVKGHRKSYDFGSRMYDNRIGRWFAPDPLETKYPSHSPYNFTINNPIVYLDYDGRDIINGVHLQAELAEVFIKKIDKNYVEKGWSHSMSKKELRDINTKLTSDEFDKLWGRYRNAEKQYRLINKNVDFLKKAAADIDAYLENYKNIDPEHFNQGNDLKYKLKSGKEEKVDIVITIEYETNKVTNGQTRFNPTIVALNGEEFIEKINDLKVLLENRTPNFTLDSNVIAHEIGHAVNIVDNPLKTYKETDENINCQDKNNHYLFQVKKAIEFQQSYDRARNNQVKKERKVKRKANREAKTQEKQKS